MPPFIIRHHLESNFKSRVISLNVNKCTGDMSVFVHSLIDVKDITVPMNQIDAGTPSVSRDMILQYLKVTVSSFLSRDECSWKLSFQWNLLQNIPMLFQIWTIMVSFRFVSCFPSIPQFLL